ncbi:hypothetical protein [Bacillus sp. 03113]|uniref:hypothetical protein n=1 Tax=Bacillus sp. 03113 TaxID=2578211 RepID=UPI001141C9EC|nr:hypothetical protein [Bacillus sp. 03113]
MTQVFKIDLDGYYVGPVILQLGENIPNDCVNIKPPNGLYKAKFVNGTWIEGLTQLEIDLINNQPKTKSELDILKETVDQLVLASLMG